MEQKNSNILKQCRDMGLKTWQCPPIIFAAMIVVTLGVTFFVASRFVLGWAEAVLIIIVLAIFYLVFGYFLLASFKKMIDAHRMEEEIRKISSEVMKEPLDNLKGGLDIIEKELNIQNQPAKEKIKSLKKSINSISRAVNFFLQINDFEKGEARMEEQFFNLGSLVRNELENFSDIIREAGFDVMLEIPEELPQVEGDKSKVGMVVKNYLDNAIKYSPAGGKINIRVESREGKVEFSVSDEGIGIKRGDQRYIFNKYFRAENARRIIGTGTGMGLYVCRLIVEACGGEVGFESKKDKGSTFWFTLPTSN